jgi:hypothetical protein
MERAGSSFRSFPWVENGSPESVSRLGRPFCWSLARTASDTIDIGGTIVVLEHAFAASRRSGDPESNVENV